MRRSRISFSLFVKVALLTLQIKACAKGRIAKCRIIDVLSHHEHCLSDVTVEDSLCLSDL